MLELEKAREIHLCPVCNRLKPSREFYFSKRGRITYCKECQKAYMNQRYKEEKAILDVSRDEV